MHEYFYLLLYCQYKTVGYMSKKLVKNLISHEHPYIKLL